MDWQHYWKAILAFAGAVASNAFADLLQSGQPWPANSGEWVRWTVSIVGTTYLVYRGPANQPKAVDAHG